MPELEPAIMWAPTLLLVTMRVAGMVVFAPVFGSEAVPLRVRLLVSVAMGLGVVGGLARPVAMPPTWLDAGMGLGCEFVIGSAIGYAARLIFVGVELGAFHVGNQMGLALAEVADSTKAEESSATGGLFRLLALVVFLAIGGHRSMIGGLMMTFEAVPPLGSLAGESLLAPVVAMLGASFVLALKVAAPVLIALLLATVAMGLLHRTVPQFNLLSTGLPVRAMLGLLVLAATLGVMQPLVEGAAGELGRSLQAITAR
jgi:flagellar biosynthetic protein FliR